VHQPDLRISVIDVEAGALLSATVPALTAGEIHVWSFSLAAPAPRLASCDQLLSSDERTRASRFHFERDANRFTVARGTVRAILGAYLRTPAAELIFVSGQNGKPALADPTSDLRFNVSHSGDRGLLGVALGCEIGVDVEAIRPDVETDKLAERFFSEHERQSIRKLPEKERVLAFFRCWTCKEAFLKGQGVGLSRSLGSFDVEVNPAQPARLLATRPDAREAAKWHLHDVATVPNYAAAVAVEGSVLGGSVTEMKVLRCE